MTFIHQYCRDTQHTLKKSALYLAVAAGLAGPVYAQDTTSSILGKITGPNGNPAPQTRVILRHQPSGTVTEVMTNSSGAYSFKGLRVGGPYEVMIDSDEYVDARLDDLYLQVGKTLRLDQQLETVYLEEVVVMGTVINSTTTGASSVFSEYDIRNTPTFDRDLKEVVRNNPMAIVDESGNLSIAGNNPRFNSITVDGIGQNDDFGLNYGGYPSQRPPVSLDAVSQISVDSAPFTAKVGGFSGGLINVVTKSGTNELEGTAFYEGMNDSLAGEPEGDGNQNIGEESTYGISAGGPLVQDKAFYFISYENFSSDQAQLYGVGGEGANSSNIAPDDYERFLSILNDTYGYSDSLSGGMTEEDEKLLVKLDINLSDRHRMDISYQSQDNEELRNTTDQPYQLKMASAVYTLSTQTDTFVSHLYSDWTDAFSTEVGLSYKDLTTRSHTASDLGQVSVDIGSDSIVFGTDRYRHANIADTSTLIFNLDGNYLLGDHELQFGYQGERLELYNLFGDSTDGVWEFSSLDDFEAKSPSYFSYRNAYTNEAEDLAYSIERFTHSLYVEDTWTVTPDLTLSYGLRYERLATDDVPPENANFVETYGFSNTENLDGLDILLPRVGFSWYLSESGTLRGGVGRYSGGKPNVWTSNSFTNDGITLVSAPYSATSAAISDPDNVDFTTVPQVVLDSMESGTGSTNYIDPDYELESDWRFQLGWDQELNLPYLGDGFLWSTEVNYIKKENSSFWVDTSRVESGRTADGGRIIYESIYPDALSDNYDLMLTNADEDGRTITWTTNITKDWANGLHLFASYTNQDITEANPGTSSTASSNYQYNVSVNRNEELIGTGYYEVEHRFLLNLGYAAHWFGDNETRFNLYYERRSGRPLSWTLGAYNDYDFGDQRDFANSDVYLPYIPTGPEDPNIDWENSSLTYAEMEQMFSAAGLSGYAGGYAEKYSTTQPWVTDLDLSIQQDLPGFVPGHTSMVYLSIDNLLNLIDSDKGQVRRMAYPQQILWDYDINETTGQYQYHEAFGGTDLNNWNEYVPEASTWRVKVGLRYNF